MSPHLSEDNNRKALNHYLIKVGTDPYSAEQLELAKHEDSNQRIRRVEK